MQTHKRNLVLPSPVRPRLSVQLLRSLRFGLMLLVLIVVLGFALLALAHLIAPDMDFFFYWPLALIFGVCTASNIAVPWWS